VGDEREDGKPTASSSGGPDSATEQPEKKPDSFLQLVVQATTLGWNLVVPIVGGVLLGRYLDDLLGKDFTWTVSLLLLGVLVAFNNLYTMYVEHSGAEPRKKQKREKRKRRRENRAEDQ
jgi:F0F1-type ATP synthase assembly protein I